MAATKTVSSESTKTSELSALPASVDSALWGSPMLFHFLETTPLRCQYPCTGVLPGSPRSTAGQGEQEEDVVRRRPQGDTSSLGRSTCLSTLPFSQSQKEILLRPSRSTCCVQTGLGTLTGMLSFYLCTNTMGSASPHL